MQEIPTDTPIMPTRAGVSHDFKSSPIYGKMPINFNAGTLEKTSFSLFLEGRITPDDLTCGFQHYVKGEGKVAIPQFDAYLLAVCYGAFSNGKERGEVNYSSNYVLDTRTDIMQSVYFLQKADGYEIKTLARGLYKTEIAPALTREGRKGFYTRVLVCYIPQLQEVRAIHLSKVAEAGFLKAIAAAQGLPEYKATFFGLSELSTQIWAFRFSGQFEPVVFAPDGARNQPPTLPAERGAAKAYFQPVVQAFVFGPHTNGWEESFTLASELRDLWFGYLSSEQAFLAQKQDEVQASAAAPVSGADNIAVALPSAPPSPLPQGIPAGRAVSAAPASPAAALPDHSFPSASDAPFREDARRGASALTPEFSDLPF